MEYHSYSQAHQPGVEQLVRLLCSVTPLTMRILRSSGYFFDQGRGWALVYDIRSHKEPPVTYTIRAQLVAEQQTLLTHLINERFRAAKSLSMALFYLHAGGWVSTTLVLFFFSFWRACAMQGDTNKQRDQPRVIQNARCTSLSGQATSS